MEHLFIGGPLDGEVRDLVSPPPPVIRCYVPGKTSAREMSALEVELIREEIKFDEYVQFDLHVAEKMPPFIIYRHSELHPRDVIANLIGGYAALKEMLDEQETKPSS